MVVDVYNTDKKYNIIYADPPWRYTGWRAGNRSVERHYSTMKEEIINMKDTIKSISDENCILFLWVTFPCLIEGLKVMKEWGFKYKTCGFNWVKRNKKSDTWFFGLGYWTRANSEICLIGTKGTIKRRSNKVSQIIDTHEEYGSLNRKRLGITIDPELDDELNRYIISQNYKKSKSYYIEQAIKMYIHQDEKVLAKQIEDSIKFNIKTFEDRYCRILAKGVKRIYANTKILLNMLAYMSNSEDDARFLLETLNEAEIDGYIALRNGIIERDIEDLFPKEELINKANKKNIEVNND